MSFKTEQRNWGCLIFPCLCYDSCIFIFDFYNISCHRILTVHCAFQTVSHADCHWFDSCFLSPLNLAFAHHLTFCLPQSKSRCGSCSQAPLHLFPLLVGVSLPSVTRFQSAKRRTVWRIVSDCISEVASSEHYFF